MPILVPCFHHQCNPHLICSQHSQSLQKKLLHLHLGNHHLLQLRGDFVLNQLDESSVLLLLYHIHRLPSSLYLYVYHGDYGLVYSFWTQELLIKWNYCLLRGRLGLLFLGKSGLLFRMLLIDLIKFLFYSLSCFLLPSLLGLRSLSRSLTGSLLIKWLSNCASVLSSSCFSGE